MSFSEDDIKQAADTKPWIEAKIKESEENIERLKQILRILDGVLRTSSFKAAADITSDSIDRPKSKENQEIKEMKTLQRARDGMILANINVYQTYLEILPVDEIQLNIDVTPFKTFFINRILEGMKKKDIELVNQGELTENEAFAYSIDTDKKIISKITITNYKDASKIKEIMNTCAWVISRMLEKKR